MRYRRLFFTGMTQTTVSKRPWFLFIAVAIPVGFFLLLEVGLRLGGFGNRYPLFIDHPARSDYRLANPEVIKRFFSDPEQAPGMKIETVYFRSQRPDGGIRIVVQGGSTAAGFPFGYGASLTGMLEQRLGRSYPDRPVEVINTAMSAINSYALLSFADEIIAIEPDAVLIYAGHNEYLGILGVGSAYLGGASPLLTRAYLRLRHLRIFQLLEQVLPAPRSVPPSGDASLQGTMMSRIAKDKNIAFGSRSYTAGLQQFQDNMSELVSRYQEAGIPVFIGTLVSNERDLPPFVGDAVTPQAREQIAAAKTALPDDADAAVGHSDAAIAIEPLAADGWFIRGRSRLQQGDNTAALADFQAARDRDRLRFRAPGIFNQLIEDLAQPDDVYLVPVEQSLRTESHDGIIGNPLLLEHVHPGLRGYFLLADAFYDSLVMTGVIGTPTAAIGDTQAWTERPLSEVDRLFGEYKVALIRNNWPFTNQPAQLRLPPPDSFESMLAQQMFRQEVDWSSAHLRLARHYRENNDRDNYTRIAVGLADAYPFRSELQFQAGVALIENGRPGQALRYLERGVEQSPQDINMLLALSHAWALNEAPESARAVLRRVLQLRPGHPTALRVLAELDLITKNPK